MKNFGRFTYYGSLGGYSHVWSTTDPPIDGARILLNEDGNTYVALRGDEHPEPTKEEIAEARALGDVLNPVAQIWLDTNDGKGVCITDGEDKPATEEEISSAEALVKGSSFEKALRTQHSKWDFGRFKYNGKFIITNSYMPIESRHTWSTAQGSKIGLREDGSLAFTRETHGLENPTAFEIAKAQSLVKHELAGEGIQDIPMRTSSKSVRGSSPNIQRMRRTPREKTRIPDFSRLGSVVGSPLIHPSPQNFGRFIYHSNLGTDHFWTTDPDSTDIAYISVNPDGTLNQSGARGVGFKAPTKEEIDTARNMVMAANLVKQGEKRERPKKWSFGISEPPVDIGGSVFKQLLNVLKPKEIPPMARQVPIYSEIKPHVLSLPALNSDPLVFSSTCNHSHVDHHGMFNIVGLAMWGVTEDTTLNVHIGGQAVFEGDVPALMFANGLSFHELYQILELKEPPDRIVSRDVSGNLITKLRTNVKWRNLDAGLIPVLKPNEYLELKITGPAKHAVFWGYRRNIVHD